MFLSSRERAGEKKERKEKKTSSLFLLAKIARASREIPRIPNRVNKSEISSSGVPSGLFHPNSNSKRIIIRFTWKSNKPFSINNRLTRKSRHPHTHTHARDINGTWIYISSHESNADSRLSFVPGN